MKIELGLIRKRCEVADKHFTEVAYLDNHVLLLLIRSDIPQLLKEVEELRDTVQDLVWQFAYRGETEKGRTLDTGGSGALECAFETLGWEDPHYPEFGGCEYPGGCKKWATCGTPTPDGYKRLCEEHYSEVNP